MNFRQIADQQKQGFLKDLDSLVSIESIRETDKAKDGQPFGPGPAKALETMLAMAERDGFAVRNIDGYAGVIELGDPENEKTLGILGHLDVVPVGQDWTKDPLHITESDGYIFGRGVIDDKGPVMAAYYAMKMIKDAGIKLNRRILLIVGCDEESGMECMDYYCKHGEIPDMGFVPDAEFPVIYAEKGIAHIHLMSEEPTRIKKLVAGTRPNVVIGKADLVMEGATPEQEALFQFYLKANRLEGSIKREGNDVIYHIDGIFGHAAWPWKGKNAALHLLNFAGAAYEDKLAGDLARLLADWQGMGLGIDIDAGDMGILTVNPGIVAIENGKTDVLLDIRCPRQTDGEKLLAKISKTLKETAPAVTARLSAWSEPLYVDPDSDLVKALMDSYQKHTGDLDSRPICIGGGTYARKFKNFVAFGPELPNEECTTDQFVGGCHQRDEGIRLENLLNAIAVYGDAILSLAGQA